MIAALISFLAGMVLGQRFKVVVLVPASGIVIIGALLDASLVPVGAWSLAAIAVLSWCTLQIGYFVGLVIRPILASGRRNQVQSHSLGRTAANEHTAL